MGCGCESCGNSRRSKMQKYAQKKTGLKTVSLPNTKGQLAMKPMGKKKKPY